MTKALLDASAFIKGCVPAKPDKATELMEDWQYFRLMAFDSRGHYFPHYAHRIVQVYPELEAQRLVLAPK